MTGTTLTHADLATAAGVSVTSIKGYRRKFPGFIPVAGWGKPIRFRPEALDVCRRIHALFQEGLSEAQVRARLRAEFPENPDQEPRPEPEPPFAAGVSQESFQEFFKAAGRMMHGMAALATAQAKADQRLARLEQALEGLSLAQAGSAEALALLAGDLKRLLSGGSRPRTIVTVRGKEGQAATYAFGEEDAAPEPASEPPSGLPSDDLPPEDLLDLPVAIRTERGEFLGVPGRLALAPFVRALERQGGHAEGSHASWTRGEEGWTLSLDMGGKRHDLFFAEAAAPSGVRVARLRRLDVDGAETSPAFLQEFLRQMRDRT